MLFGCRTSVRAIFLSLLLALTAHADLSVKGAAKKEDSSPGIGAGSGAAASRGRAPAVLLLPDGTTEIFSK